MAPPQVVQLLISDLLLSLRTALWQKQAGASQALGETYHASGAELAGFQRDLGSLRRLAHSFCPAYHKVRPGSLVGRADWGPQGPAQHQRRLKEWVLGSHPVKHWLGCPGSFVQLPRVEYLLWLVQSVVVSRPHRHRQAGWEGPQPHLEGKDTRGSSGLPAGDAGVASELQFLLLHPWAPGAAA